MVNYLTGIISSALIASALLSQGYGFTPSYLLSTRVRSNAQPRPAFLRSELVHPTARWTNPLFSAAQNPDGSPITPSEVVQPELTKEQQLALQQQQMNEMWSQVQAYLGPDAGTLQELHDMRASAEDKERFYYRPKAAFAEAAYFFTLASPETKQALRSLTQQWFDAAKNYEYLLHVQGQQDPKKVRVVDSLVRFSLTVNYHLFSDAVLEAIEKLQPELLAAHPINKQQWLILNERWQRIVTCNYFANGRLNNDEHSALGVAFNEAYAGIHEAMEKVNSGDLSGENWVAMDYYMFKAVVAGEQYFNAHNKKDLLRFKNKRAGKYAADAKREPRANKGIMHFQKDEPVEEDGSQVLDHQGIKHFKNDIYIRDPKPEDDYHSLWWFDDNSNTDRLDRIEEKKRIYEERKRTGVVEDEDEN